MASSQGENVPEQEVADAEPPPEKGRPPGVPDEKPRYRHTGQHIGEDKIHIAQMKLDTVREAEEKKLANKNSKTKNNVC